ncbi:MAG: DNA/RNA non-specific endonuclease [Bryobacteraceae bacterium]
MRRAATLLLLAIPLLAGPDPSSLPACSAPDQELAVRTAFVLCHSASLRVPLWTAYELTPDRLHGSAPRPKGFRRDPNLAHPGAALSDYRNSGFSRGHRVPAADLAWNEHALRESFQLSNVVPQDPKLNSGRWRALENEIRRLTATADIVLVFTGPVFCPDSPRIGDNAVAVPCELYKVAVIARGATRTVLAAILPNSGNPVQALSAFFCSLSEVERRTGLRFLMHGTVPSPGTPSPLRPPGD